MKDNIKDRPTYLEACAVLGTMFNPHLQNFESDVFWGNTKLYSIVHFWTTFAIYAVAGNGHMYLPGIEYNNVLRDFPQFKERLAQMRRDSKRAL